MCLKLNLTKIGINLKVHTAVMIVNKYRIAASFRQLAVGSSIIEQSDCF